FHRRHLEELVRLGTEEPLEDLALARLGVGPDAPLRYLEIGIGPVHLLHPPVGTPDGDGDHHGLGRGLPAPAARLSLDLLLVRDAARPHLGHGLFDVADRGGPVAVDRSREVVDLVAVHQNPRAVLAVAAELLDVGAIGYPPWKRLEEPLDLGEEDVP